MRRSYLHNPEAYLDEKGVAHVLVPEHQEGIGGPRVSRMVEALGISRKQADHLRQRMRDDDAIEDILVEANRVCRGKGHFYYPGAADTPEQPDGIAFVDRGDLGRETLIYDHRDGRFVLNAVGPSVARQRERFAKRNPRRFPARIPNPPRTIACLTGDGAWWSVSASQWPKVVRAGMAGDNGAAAKQATSLRQKPSVAVGGGVPVLRRIFDFTPEDWEYYDKEVRGAARAAEQARSKRRKNPRPARETLYVVDTSPSGKVVTIRDATLDEIRFGDAMPYDQAVYWASVFTAETSGARVVDTSSHAKNP